MKQEELKKINGKYRKILAEQAIAAEIVNVHGDDPIQEIVSDDGKQFIRLNMDRIESCEYGNYEDFLSSNVRKLVLPNFALESERLVLRRMREEDAADLFEIREVESDAWLAGMTPYAEMNESYMELMRSFSKNEGQYALVEKNTGRAIGSVNLMPCDNRQVECIELGWFVNPGSQRKGYAFEGISCLLDYLMNELHLDMVVAAAIEDNAPSLNLIKKLGFTYEGNIRKAFWYPPKGKVDLMSFYKER